MAELSIAFKEWDVVDAALGAGEQTILIRKGGIHEKHGRFEVEYDRFLIYPTRLHQSPDMLKEPYRSRLAPLAPAPDSLALITIRHLVTVEGVFLAPAEEHMARWDSLHVYSPELIRARYRYSADRPLYILFVRAYRLAVPQTIIETAAYAGCRSWVTLKERFEIGMAKPIVEDNMFIAAGKQVRSLLTG